MSRFIHIQISTDTLSSWAMDAENNLTNWNVKNTGWFISHFFVLLYISMNFISLYSLTPGSMESITNIPLVYHLVPDISCKCHPYRCLYWSMAPALWLSSGVLCHSWSMIMPAPNCILSLIHKIWNTLQLSVHYSDIIMSVMVPQITGVSIVCSIIGSGADHRKHKALCHWPLWGELTSNWWIPCKKRPVTRQMFPFDDVFMHKFVPLYNPQFCHIICHLRF